MTTYKTTQCMVPDNVKDKTQEEKKKRNENHFLLADFHLNFERSKKDFFSFCVSFFLVKMGFIKTPERGNE